MKFYYRLVDKPGPPPAVNSNRASEAKLNSAVPDMDLTFAVD